MGTRRNIIAPLLKTIQASRPNTLLPGARNAQPDGAQAGHETPLVVAIAIAALPALTPFVRLAAGKAVSLPLRLQLEKPPPSQLGLAIQIAPECLLHLPQEVLEMLADRCYLRHRV